MKLLLTLFVVTTVSVYQAFGDQWALLLSGGYSYLDYNMEANVCHAYHVLRAKGIPEDRIIVMMWDGIASDNSNPFPGTIVNRPNGTNVYKGVKIDYGNYRFQGNLFPKILAGDEKAVHYDLGYKGRVIKSGRDDTVFVYIANAGGPYFVLIGDTLLFAGQLNKVIKRMHKRKQYKEMVFYLEGSESGSMFNTTLHKDINVFAVTSTNPNQNRGHCFWDPTRSAFVGDIFSVSWMEDSEQSDVARESIHRQYQHVRAKTRIVSDARKYGDMSIQWRKVGNFQGNVSIKNEYYNDLSDNSLYFQPESETVDNPEDICIHANISEGIQIEILKRKLATASKEDRLKHELAIRDLVKRKNGVRIYFKSIVESFENLDYDEIHQMPLHSTDLTCYQQGIAMIMQSCPGLNLLQNRHALRSLRALANLCETDASKEMIWAAIKLVSSTSDVC